VYVFFICYGINFYVLLVCNSLFREELFRILGKKPSLKDVNKKYEFRVAAKCQAGFVNISDIKGTPQDAISGWSKNSLVNIQVKITYENGHTTWNNVFTTKGG
jgi:hypothetical protein